jgi:hypothetical protein
MASMIPAHVVCGNKVPTVIFPTDGSEDRLFAWIAIVNSIPFDWALRRVLTTTVNYFVLQSIPMPRLMRDGLPWNWIVAAARDLHSLDHGGKGEVNPERIEQLRADIDTEVALAYGLSFEDLKLVFADFPLLDRGQPPLPGEARSTITRDLVLTTATRRMAVEERRWATRLVEARARGARAYVPSELALSGQNVDEEQDETNAG